jgi:hypothetical protein
MPLPLGCSGSSASRRVAGATTPRLTAEATFVNMPLLCKLRMPARPLGPSLSAAAAAVSTASARPPLLLCLRCWLISFARLA